MKKRMLLESITFYTIVITIQFSIFCSSAISADLDDIEKFSLEAIPCTVTIPVVFNILRYDNGVTGME